MARSIIAALAVYYLLIAAIILFAPQYFYDTTPGVGVTGPFNSHFITDVGFAFLSSGGALAWGALKRHRAIVFAGLAWPALHALYHLQIWIAQGAPANFVAAADLMAVLIPAGLTLWAATKLEEQAA